MRPRRALPDGRLVRQLMADLLADGTSLQSRLDHLNLSTLETQESDSLDFHDVIRCCLLR
jgi:hypothetical protein